MPECFLHLAAGRSPEQKKACGQEITAAISKTLGIPAEHIIVTLVEAPLNSKMKGGTLYSEM